MSIWGSIGANEPSVRALDGADQQANLRAEGDLDLIVDVATTTMHDHVRLGVWSEDMRTDVTALLPRAQATLLRDRLSEALA